MIAEVHRDQMTHTAARHHMKEEIMGLEAGKNNYWEEQQIKPLYIHIQYEVFVCAQVA